MKWMDTAWTQVGTTEISGPGANPQVLAYFAGSGHPEITSDETAWCAAFVGYCLSSSGIALNAIPHGDRLMARAYLKFGTPIDEPRIGALVVFSRPGGGPGAGHVGFVSGWTASTLMVLGGNQADSVSVKAFPRTSVLGYRWPQAPQTPAEVAAGGSRIATAARTQVADGTKTGVAQLAQGLPAPPPGLGSLAEQAGSMQASVETLIAFGGFAWGKLPWIAGALTLYWLGRMAWNAWQIKYWRAEDHNEGRTIAPSGRAFDAAGDSPVGSRPPAGEGTAYAV